MVRMNPDKYKELMVKHAKLSKELKEAHAKLARVLTDNTTLRSRLSVMREDLEYCIRMLERVSFKEKAVSEK